MTIQLAFMKIYTEYLNASPIPCFNPEKDQTKYPKNAYHLKDMNTFNMNILFLILPLGIIRNNNQKQKSDKISKNAYLKYLHNYDLRFLSHHIKLYIVIIRKNQTKYRKMHSKIYKLCHGSL